MLIVQFSEHFPFAIDKASIMHIKAHLLFICNIKLNLLGFKMDTKKYLLFMHVFICAIYFLAINIILY